VIGVIAGLIGVAIMVGSDALAGIGGELLAQLAILGAAVSYAVAGVYGRRFRRFGTTPTQTAAGQLAGSTLLLLPVALAWDQPWELPLPSMTIWLAVVSLALFSTALAYIIYFRVLANAGATNLMLVTFLVPISAGLLGVLILGEHLTGGQLIGMLLIGIGLAAIDGRPLTALIKSWGHRR
jgi:drug/metabolite transporter (DMT)-like permease